MNEPKIETGFWSQQIGSGVAALWGRPDISTNESRILITDTSFGADLNAEVSNAREAIVIISIFEQPGMARHLWIGLT